MTEMVTDVTPAQWPDRPVRLREAREAAGLHIAALSAALKVPVRKLEALEAGRYDELPDLTFARALASSACRHLKIDPAAVLEQIPLNPKPALAEREGSSLAPFKAASEAPAASPLSWLSRPAMLGAIVLLLAALVVMFLPSMESSAPEPAAAPTAPSMAPAAPLFQPGAPESGEGSPDPAEPRADAPVGNPTGTPPVAAAAAPVAPGAVAPTPVGETGATPAGGAVLALQATQESWVEVSNGTGTLVLQRLLQAGERVEFSAAPPYNVVLGNAGVVQVTVRGRPFNVTANARNNVARFEAK